MLGIDISKASFDVAVLINDKYQNKHFNNNIDGFKALFKWLKPIKKDKVFCYGVLKSEQPFDVNYAK